MQKSPQQTPGHHQPRPMAIILTAMGLLLLMVGCSEQMITIKEKNSVKMTDNTRLTTTDRIYRVPPIDAAAPLETETATLALG